MADVVRALVEKAPHRWEGTATDLLTELNQRTSEAIKRRKDWFSRPRQISDAMRRLAPSLRKGAIEVTLPDKHNREPGTGRRLITVEWISPDRTDPGASHSSHAAVVSSSQPGFCDAGGDLDIRSIELSLSAEARILGLPDERDQRDARDARSAAIAANRCCGKYGAELRCQLCRWSPTYSPVLRQARDAEATGR